MTAEAFVSAWLQGRREFDGVVVEVSPAFIESWENDVRGLMVHYESAWQELSRDRGIWSHPANRRINQLTKMLADRYRIRDTIIAHAANQAMVETV